MNLRDHGVDSRPDVCFSEGVPRKHTKAKDMDRELDALLGAIEAAWRERGHTNLREFVFKGDDEEGIVPESTWHDWRSGKAAPDYLELRRVARAVGLDVGLRTQDGVDRDGAAGNPTAPGGVQLKPETAEVVRLMENAPDDARIAIRDAALKRNGELLANPLDADVAQNGPHARSK